jgi:hypothetical protein
MPKDLSLQWLLPLLRAPVSAIDIERNSEHDPD